MTQAEAEQLSGFVFTPGWTFHDIHMQGKLSGFVMERDGEIHCWRLPAFNGAWFTRKDVDHLITPLIKKYGFVTTKVKAENRVGQRFVKRLGFVKIATHGDEIIYLSEAFNHARH